MATDQMHSQLKEGVLPQIRLASPLRFVGVQGVQRRLATVARLSIGGNGAGRHSVQYLLGRGLAFEAEQRWSSEWRSADGGRSMTRRLGVRSGCGAAVLRAVVRRIVGALLVVVGHKVVAVLVR